MTGLSTDYERDCKVDIGSYVEASTDATVTNDNTEQKRSCVALGPVGNRQGPIKCFNIESGKILHLRTLTQLPCPLANRLVKKVEAWDKRGARVIKKGCIEFLNRNGENFDWENDDLSELEVVNKQPRLVDPGVADIPLDAGPKEDLGGSPEVKEKPPYATRVVEARHHAGLDVKSEPRQSQGVEVRDDGVIVIDDDGNEVQVEVSKFSEGAHGTGRRDIYSLLPRKGRTTRPLGSRTQGKVQGVMPPKMIHTF